MIFQIRASPPKPDTPLGSRLVEWLSVNREVQFGYGNLQTNNHQRTTRNEKRETINHQPSTRNEQRETINEQLKNNTQNHAIILQFSSRQ